MISPDDVHWAYGKLLGRLPESREVVSEWIRTCDDVRSLVESMIASVEFEERQRLLSLQTQREAVLLHRTRYGFLQPIAFNEPMMIQSYVWSDYEAQESAFTADSLRPGDATVDLGARHGWFTGIMAARVGAAGVVYAFEPDTVAAVTQRLIDENGFSQVELIRKAASDANGEMSFDNVTASLAPGGARRVPVVRLDDELARRRQPLAFFKVDIEGAEHRALKGAEQIIRNDRPLMLIELNEGQQQTVSGVSALQPLKTLRSAGYAVFDLASEAVGDEALQRLLDEDVIFNVVARPL